MAPRLRTQGWRGSGGRFVLPDPTHHLLLGFRGSTYSDSQTVRFTVNLATIDKAAWETRHEGWWGKPSANAVGPIGVQHRLGELMPQAQDTWWDLSDGEDSRDLADLLCSAIERYGVPALHAGRSLPQASTPWLELDPIARGEVPS